MNKEELKEKIKDLLQDVCYDPFRLINNSSYYDKEVDEIVESKLTQQPTVTSVTDEDAVIKLWKFLLDNPSARPILSTQSDGATIKGFEIDTTDWDNEDLLESEFKSEFIPLSKLTTPKQSDNSELYTREQVEGFIHTAVNNSHCHPDRVKHAHSNACAEWSMRFIKKELPPKPKQ